MPTTPYARLLVSIDGGAPASGLITADAGASCEVSYESTIGWTGDGQAVPYLEIFAYPVGWTPGAGWLSESVTQPAGGTATVFRYYGATPPPAFTLPDASHWGDILFGLVVNNGRKAGKLSDDVADYDTMVRVESASGLWDVPYRGGRQLGPYKWIHPTQHNLRVLETFMAGGSGVGLDATTAVLENATTALNANGIPILAAPSTIVFASSAAAPLAASRGAAQATTSAQVGYDERTVTDASGHGATGTTGYRSMLLPDGAGAPTEAARFSWSWSTIVGPVATWGLDVATNPGGGGLLRAITVTGGGGVRLHGTAYAHNGYRLILDASGNLTASAVSFAEVKAALAAADSTVDFNGQSLTGIGDATVGGNLVVSGDLTVSGTTTTVNSTAVSLADRLVVFNSSTGIVPVPVNIAGFVIDRGSADGVTKRDQPGVFWDETNSRFDLALNTAGDQSTIGAFVALKVKALTVSDFGAGIVRSSSGGVLSSSALTFAEVNAVLAAANAAITVNGQTITAGGFIGPTLSYTGGDITITPDASYQLVVRRDGLTTTNAAGVSARNGTAATAIVTVQYGGAVLSEGSSWSTSAGGSAKTIRAGHLAKSASGSTPTCVVQTLYDQGDGVLHNGDYYTTSDPGLGGLARVVGTLIIDTTGNGVRFSNNGNPGLKQVSTDFMVTSGGSNGVGFGTNSTWRFFLASTGALTQSFDSAALWRVQWGTAGTNYVDRTGKAATVPAGTTATLYTIATASNSYVKVEVEATAYDTTSVASCMGFGKRRRFKNIAGTVTAGTQTDFEADDPIGTTWGAPPSLSITYSGTNILVQGTATTNDAKFILHEVRVFAGTTGA